VDETKNHADQAVLLLLRQFRDMPNFEGLIRAIMPQVQELEPVLFDLDTEMRLGNAAGAQLDMLGRVVQRLRGTGDTDSVYETRIRARIRANRSEGRPDDILETLRLMMPDAENTITLEEYISAALVIRIADTLEEDPQALAEEIRRARSGGVRQTLEYQLFDDAVAFTFADGASAEFDEARGWAAIYSFLAVGTSLEIQGATDGSDWGEETGPGSALNLFGVAFDRADSSLAVVVGALGRIGTSPNLVDWTQRTAAGGFVGVFYGVAHDGSGLWCSVGSTGEIQTSPDGITWTVRTPAGGFSDIFYGVAHDLSSTWCAVGEGGEIQTSPTGTLWSARSADGSYVGDFRGVAHDGSALWCAVGTGGEIQTSPTATGWTERKSSGNDLHAVAYGNGLWCAVGASGGIWTSPDGITWTQRTAAGSYAGSFHGVAHVLCHDGVRRFVAVGTSAEIQSSEDGTTWTQETPAGSYAGDFYGCAAIPPGGLMAYVREA